MIRIAAFSLALASPAGAFELAWPVDCRLGDTCHIQQYPDHDPGPAATDFTCGTLSYDGHDGTDIALPTRAAMQACVAVLAAAPGTVRGVRDGIADFAPVIAGKECGNGLVIDHGQGWVTQYCHLRQGSLAVRSGQSVAVGDTLGLIGQSGLAEFPHVHLAVRQDDTRVDPFAPDANTCGATGKTLWNTPIPYDPGGLLDAGFSPAVPDFDLIRAGLSTAPLPASAPGLVLWAYAFGTRAGDEMTFRITGPEGALLSETATLEKTQAQMFRAMGKRLTLPNWPPGTYQGEVHLLRKGVLIDRISAQVTVGE